MGYMPESIPDDTFGDIIETYKKKKVLEELGIVKKKTKFAARLLRGLTYSAITGPITGILFAGMGMVAQAMNSATMYTPSLLGTMGLVMGFAAPLALEISKDMDE